MANDFPICMHPLRDCRSKDEWGRCTALTDVNFGERTCPFYKRGFLGKETRNGQSQRQ